MELVRLTPDYVLSPFDCGDSDLNDFLFEDAKNFQEKRIANTFSKHYRGQHVGSDLMTMIKVIVNENQNYSAFRFITVDAYLSAIPFYVKNGFIQLTQKEEDDHTRLMFFDMLEVA